MAAVVFDLGPKDPEEPHIADEVHPASVHEHGGEDVPPAARDVAGEFDGQESRTVDGFFQANAQLPGDEDVGVDRDEEEGDERKSTTLLVVAERDHATSQIRTPSAREATLSSWAGMNSWPT